MGWSFHSSLRSKADLIRYLTVGTETLGAEVKCIAKCVKGSTLWAVHEYAVDRGGYKAGHRFIACYLMGADQGWWGSKDMDESCGPCEVSCPLAYLDMVPDPGGYATAWRGRVRAHHAKAATFNGLKVGQKVRLKPGCAVNGEPLVELEISSVRPLRGKFGFRELTLRKSLIAEVL